MEYYSAIKNNELMPFAATWMDLEIIIQARQRKTNIIRYHSCVGSNLKKDINELVYKIETDLQTIEMIPESVENKLMVTKTESWQGGINQKLGMNTYTLLYTR